MNMGLRLVKYEWTPVNIKMRALSNLGMGYMNMGMSTSEYTYYWAIKVGSSYFRLGTLIITYTFMTIVCFVSSFLALLCSVGIRFHDIH